MAHRALKEYPQARALLDRALSIREHALGPEHPDLAYSLSNLGNLHRDMQEYTQAKAMYERARPIWERVGPEHPLTARNLFNLGVVTEALGQDDEAKPLYERALSIWEKVGGPTHPDVVAPLTKLGQLHARTGEYASAIEQLERAVVVQSAEAPASPQLAATQMMLAQVSWDAPASAGGDRAKARAQAEQARHSYQQAGDADEQLARVSEWLATHR
jgi:tetratricopeptide (TPR) repeat protein